MKTDKIFDCITASCHTTYFLYKPEFSKNVYSDVQGTVSTSTNFRAIGIKLVLVEFLPDCYVVKSVLVEICYVIPTSTNFS